VNPGTQDKQYIRKGNATIKTSAQRTFSISGDRTHGDAWQDWVTSLAVMFGTGSAVIVPVCLFLHDSPERARPARPRHRQRRRLQWRRQ